MYMYYHIDIDECTDGSNKCSQKCVNEEGTYHCECNTGYLLDQNGLNCNGKLHCHNEGEG